MISQFFYIPSNQKATEEQRIEFTEGKIKAVKDMLSEHFLKQLTDESGWKVHVGKTVVINLNWWNKNIEEFQLKNRCKIELIDYEYLLMQLWRDVNGKNLSLAKSTLSVSLFKPKDM